MSRISLTKFYVHTINLLKIENGQALSEYSITLVLLVIVTIAAITALGVSVKELLQNSTDALTEI
ncbi:MAG: hypothetical protein KJZ86_18950 [Caldilineaceae bacterium]|nr:hypothetical protein [Caldilineaceae bacterium]HRJ42019.1 hypothetical protein [Caldilineaceae bacterium]